MDDDPRLDVGSLEHPSVMVQRRLAGARSYETEARELLEAVEQRLGSAAATDVTGTVRFIEELDDGQDSGYRDYLAHPLRVARMLLILDPSISTEDLRVALVHNVFEVNGLKKADLLEHGLTLEQVEVVEAMTVDRSRESDSSYLQTYYERLWELGDKAATLRCVDRLDNLLAILSVEDRALRTSYLANTEEHVLPLASKVDPALGDYLDMLLDEIRGRDV